MVQETENFKKFNSKTSPDLSDEERMEILQNLKKQYVHLKDEQLLNIASDKEVDFDLLQKDFKNFEKRYDERTIVDVSDITKAKARKLLNKYYDLYLGEKQSLFSLLKRAYKEWKFSNKAKKLSGNITVDPFHIDDAILFADKRIDLLFWKDSSLREPCAGFEVLGYNPRWVTNENPSGIILCVKNDNGFWENISFEGIKNYLFSTNAPILWVEKPISQV